MRFSAVVLFAAAASAAMEYNYEYEEVSSSAAVEYTSTEEPTSTAYYDATYTSSKAKQYTTSTVYATEVHTVTDCPDYVTKCPHDKIKVVTETIAVSTTVCPVDEVEETPYPKPHHPYGHKNKTMSYEHKYPEESSTYMHKYPKASSTDDSHPIYPTEMCGKEKVKTISTSYTTVLPTVIYETYTEECAKPTKPAYPAYPSSGPGCKGYNCSSPITKPDGPVTAGAGSVVGSVLFAAAAGVAAFALA